MTDPRSYFFNELVSSQPGGRGYSDTTGRIRQPKTIHDRAKTKIIVIDGQSEHATANGTMRYKTISPFADNFNPYDGEIYHGGTDPVLGASSIGDVEPSSLTMRIADALLTIPRIVPIERVIMANVSIGGTPWAAYRPDAVNSLLTRFENGVLRRLVDMGLMPDDLIMARGRTDVELGTSATSVRDSILAYTDHVRSVGYTGRIWLSKFTHETQPNNPTRDGIEQAIAARSSDLLPGLDGDLLLPASGGFRLGASPGYGPHLSDLGLATGAHAYADLLYERSAAQPSNEENDSFTKVLLTFNGQGVVDSAIGGSPKTWTYHSGGWADTPDHTDFDLSNNFRFKALVTVDAAGVGTDRTIAGHTRGANNSPDYGWYWLLNAQNKLSAGLSDAAGSDSVVSSATFGPGQHLFEFERAENIMKISADGVPHGSGPVTRVPRNSVGKFAVGQFGEYMGLAWSGQIHKFSLRVG